VLDQEYTVGRGNRGRKTVCKKAMISGRGTEFKLEQGDSLRKVAYQRSGVVALIPENKGSH